MGWLRGSSTLPRTSLRCRTVTGLLQCWNKLAFWAWREKKRRACCFLAQTWTLARVLRTLHISACDVLPRGQHPLSEASSCLITSSILTNASGNIEADHALLLERQWRNCGLFLRIGAGLVVFSRAVVESRCSLYTRTRRSPTIEVFKPASRATLGVQYNRLQCVIYTAAPDYVLRGVDLTC